MVQLLLPTQCLAWSNTLEVPGRHMLRMGPMAHMLSTVAGSVVPGAPVQWVVGLVESHDHAILKAYKVGSLGSTTSACAEK